MDISQLDEEEQLAIREQILDFQKNADQHPYRQAMRFLIDSFKLSHQAISQQGVDERHTILEQATDDDEAVRYIESFVDEAAVEMYEELFHGHPMEGLTEEETFMILIPYIFCVEMFRYLSARDKEVSPPGGNENSDVTMSGFIAQCEVNFNPALAQYRTQDEDGDESPVPDKSKLH